MSMDVRQLYAKALETYGPEAQTLMVMEEMAELQQALCHHARGRGGGVHIAEEIADVQIVLEQMVQLHNCADAVSCFREEKLLRLKERLKGFNDDA